MLENISCKITVAFEKVKILIGFFIFLIFFLISILLFSAQNVFTVASKNHGLETRSFAKQFKKINGVAEIVVCCKYSYK